MYNSSNERAGKPLFGDVLFTYTRAQALADEVLVDAGPLAQEAGFRLPVAITAAAWDECVAWTEDDSRLQVHQDQSGRLWDVLFMAAHAIRTEAGSGSRMLFALCRVPRDGHSVQAGPVQLKLIVGPGDHGDPVVTILLPEED